MLTHKVNIATLMCYFIFVLVLVCFEVMKGEDCKIADGYMIIIVGGKRKLRLSLGMAASASGVAQVHPKLITVCGTQANMY